MLLINLSRRTKIVLTCVVLAICGTYAVRYYLAVRSLQRLYSHVRGVPLSLWERAPEVTNAPYTVQCDGDEGITLKGYPCTPEKHSNSSITVCAAPAQILTYHGLWMPICVFSRSPEFVDPPRDCLDGVAAALATRGDEIQFLAPKSSLRASFRMLYIGTLLPDVTSEAKLIRRAHRVDILTGSTLYLVTDTGWLTSFTFRKDLPANEFLAEKIQIDCPSARSAQEEQVILSRVNAGEAMRPLLPQRRITSE